MSKKLIFILAAVLIIAAVGIGAVLNAAPDWDPYLWAYQTGDEAVTDEENLQESLRVGLQDINKSGSSNGLTIDVLQSFGSARSISVLFKVTFPKEVIDLSAMDSDEVMICPLLENARFYKGEIAQEDISGLTPYAIHEMKYKKDQIAVSSNPGTLKMMAVLLEENAALYVLERSSYYDVYNKQKLSMVIQGFERHQGEESTVLWEDNPIAVSWTAENKGKTVYFAFDNETIRGTADISASQFHLNLSSSDYQNIRELMREVKFLDKDKNPLDIDLRGSSAANEGSNGDLSVLIYLKPPVDISVIKYLQIGEEIFLCE